MSRILSLGVRYGSERRTNDWYRTHQPEALARAAERGLAKAFSDADGDGSSAGFDTAMRRYQRDPFRGATIRYKLGPGESSRTLEEAAARDALAAADVSPEDVDLALCASWLPEDFVAPGNAVYLARALGMSAPAINVETACSSGLASLELADSLLSTGRHRRVLVALSNTVSRQADDANTLSWISSDVAAAALIEADEGHPLIHAVAMENTAATCDSFVHRVRPGEDGDARVRMEVGAAGTRALRATSGPELVARLCRRALDRAGLGVEDIRLFACSTPLAWFAELCREALGASPEQVQDLFPRLGNAGLPFPVVHLHHATAEGRLAPGEKVLIYTVGSVSSAGAMVVEASDWRLGPHPGVAASPCRREPGPRPRSIRAGPAGAPRPRGGRAENPG